MSDRRGIVDQAIVTEDDTQAVRVTSNRKARAVVFCVSAGSATLSFVWTLQDARSIGQAILDAVERATK